MFFSKSKSLAVQIHKPQGSNPIREENKSHIGFGFPFISNYLVKFSAQALPHFHP